jgi:hypothetical protein
MAGATQGYAKAGWKIYLMVSHSSNRSSTAGESMQRVWVSRYIIAFQMSRVWRHHNRIYGTSDTSEEALRDKPW